MSEVDTDEVLRRNWQTVLRVCEGFPEGVVDMERLRAEIRRVFRDVDPTVLKGPQPSAGRRFRRR